jgi:hypothetical protein
MTDPAFIAWWATQMVPPDPTPAQLRAWCRRAWEAATERAAGIAEAVYRGPPEDDTWGSHLLLHRETAEAIAAAIRAGGGPAPTFAPL